MSRALLLCSAVLLLAGCDASQGKPAAPAPSPYRAASVGRIDSQGEARELVAAADGVIARVMVRRGDHVRAGQVLLVVDCAPRTGQAEAALAGAQQSSAAAALVLAGPRREQIAASRAAVAQAQARQINAQQALDRAAALIANGFVSHRDLEARTAERDAASAARAEAQAGLAQLTNGARPLERVAAAAGARAQRGQARAASARAGPVRTAQPG